MKTFIVNLNGTDVEVEQDSDGKFIIPERLRGLGTQLKPAVEMWWLVRKPLSEKTVAKNVLKWGTGAINIEGCRVGSEILPSKTAGQAKLGTFESHNMVTPERQGRFPANLVLDATASEMLDEQSGTLTSGKMKAGTKRSNTKGYSGPMPETTGEETLGDSGGASRFFYVAKASKKDKGTGNTHPTVKNTKLMEYLIKLVTPTGGTTLDPFMGSGSTGVAAIRLGFGFIGIEREAEYFEICEQRIAEEIIKYEIKGLDRQTTVEERT